MSEESSPIPPKVLIAAGLLLAVTMALVAFGRITGIGKLKTPVADAVRSVEIRFHDTPDGGISVTYGDGRPLTELAAGTNGFIRGVMRSLARARRLDRIEVDPPFRLTLWSDHRLTIEDPATSQSLDLSGFGQDNLTAFARLLATNATKTPGRQD